MKNLIRKSLLIATIFVSTITMAKSNDPSIKVDVVNSKFVQFTMEGNLNIVELSVKDESGFVLHSEKLQDSKLSRKFDLESLPNGHYSLEVESLTKIKRIPFVVLKHTVEISKEKEVVYYKPVVVTKDKLVSISQFAKTDESLEISVYDLNNDLLYNEILKEESNILKRRLSFKNLLPGNYKLVLRTGNKNFYETISI